ncbi:hypothetical protein EMIHUDRAFT_237629 [Emiliania huxleyi CCMP1516]|uniref:C2 domain-containing protein n=2 Tax=Emiliania huxleyi TaxID=2903 RepID=A0A0D3JPS6_EMIH1|nr:hypothetical protein EMIHUDRAFT_237629 [Emiliania huxleyi CCMP1516]EOD25511.1 hypothetical protein EMIHUDRAFT_237629 [Emiliania huxleyi CCMP1516]|eukprot:XP_005777940.1 hypothetical protein EMIHUDRAFT_237629 [Emiliania huxleyi CCMP1516]
MAGLYLNSVGGCKSLYCLEEAKCCRIADEHTCNKVDILLSFNTRGWASCPSNQYMGLDEVLHNLVRSGLWRNSRTDSDPISLIETVDCCGAKDGSGSMSNSLEVLEVDILWPRWVARIGVTRATEACFLAADRHDFPIAYWDYNTACCKESSWSGGKCAGNRGTEGSDFVWCDSAFKDRVPFPGCRNNDENWAVCPGDKVLTGIYRGGGGEPTHGVLKITVVSGRDVRGKGGNEEGTGDRDGLETDPYVKVSVNGGLPRQTDHKDNTDQPVWNKDMDFGAQPIGATKVKVELWDRDPAGNPDDHMGTKEFSVYHTGTKELEQFVSSEDGEGHIKLRVTFDPQDPGAGLDDIEMLRCCDYDPTAPPSVEVVDCYEPKQQSFDGGGTKLTWLTAADAPLPPDRRGCLEKNSNPQCRDFEAYGYECNAVPAWRVMQCVR